MTKGLEALERLDKELLIEDMQQYLFLSCYDTIKKELKSLEIIIKKDVDTGQIPYYVKQAERHLKYYEDPVEAYNDFEIQNEDYKLTKEEFDLLKEVIMDDSN